MEKVNSTIDYTDAAKRARYMTLMDGLFPESEAARNENQAERLEMLKEGKPVWIPREHTEHGFVLDFFDKGKHIAFIDVEHDGTTDVYCIDGKQPAALTVSFTSTDRAANLIDAIDYINEHDTENN